MQGPSGLICLSLMLAGKSRCIFQEPCATMDPDIAMCGRWHALGMLSKALNAMTLHGHPDLASKCVVRSSQKPLEAMHYACIWECIICVSICQQRLSVSKEGLLSSFLQLLSGYQHGNQLPDHASRCLIAFEKGPDFMQHHTGIKLIIGMELS